MLAELPDSRKARGKRPALPAILALVGVATLCGYRSYRAIAQWARISPAKLVRALGCTHRTPPWAATLHTVLRSLHRTQVEAALGAWAERVLAQVPPSGPPEDEAIAIDGQALRGSRQQGAPQAHRLSALSQRRGLTVGQRAVADKTNEITQIVPLLLGLVIDGRVFTMDALLTQRTVAQTIVEGHGDYVLSAKGNQPRLPAAIEQVFATPPATAAPPPATAAPPPATASTTERGHGRLESRRLTVREAQFTGRDAWPGRHQVFPLARETQVLATGKHRQEVVYGLTSLAPLGADAGTDPAADATRLLGLTRHQWHIEHRSHYVRDVTFDEDRSQVRCGSLPEVLAAFRNTAIGLLRLVGERGCPLGDRRRLPADGRPAPDRPRPPRHHHRQLNDPFAPAISSRFDWDVKGLA